MSIQYKNHAFRLALNRGHDTRHTDRRLRDRQKERKKYNHKVGRDQEVCKTYMLALLGLVAWR